MRALLIALVLALATAVPVFADDDGGAASAPVAPVDIAGPVM